MKTIEKKEQTKKEKAEELALSKEFKEELKGEKSKRKKNTVTLSLIILNLLVFGILAVGAYQIFFKSEGIEQTKDDASKIENRPQVEEPVQKEPVPVTTTEPAPTPTPTPAPATTPTVTQYTVQSGDTWSSVANANSMTSKELMDYNGATSEDLQIGQVIKIPK